MPWKALGKNGKKVWNKVKNKGTGDYPVPLIIRESDIIWKEHCVK